MKSTKISRKELSDKLSEGAQRKRTEREKLLLKVATEGEKAVFYMEMVDWLSLDIRYHEVAAAYYADDIDSLENGSQDDLLFLVESSGIPPKMYAQYLREVDPKDRADEKMTHAAVEGLKKAMRDTLEAKI